MARIGIYGGSFNPPHIGHIRAAEQLISILQLDRLLVIPAGIPPHKKLADGTPPEEERLLLCQAAFSAVEKAEVSDIEILRSGISYTVDTVKELHERYPDDSLFLVMGTDMLLSFSSWYHPEEIVQYATLAVMHRYENDAALNSAVCAAINQIRTQFAAEVLTVENEPIATSSTEVRRMIAFGCPEGLVSRETAEMIRTNAYYMYGRDKTHMPLDELINYSLSLHDAKRVPHVLGCCETAQLLAKQYGADQADAARAGILHDVTKALSYTAQLLLCEHYHIALSDAERCNSKLLHAKTGAAVAKYVFGENDAVCSAIYWHTTGKADMSLLEKIIYIADYMEPNRDFDGVEVLRALVREDLDAALLEGFRMSLELLKRKGKVIDPNSLQAWEYLSAERRQIT